MRKDRPSFSLQTIITVFACIVVALSLTVTDLLISNKVAEDTQDNLTAEAIKVSRIVANHPAVIEALSGRRNESEIQTYVEKIKTISNVHFITVLDMNRVRKSHPSAAKIGEFYAEHDVDPVFYGSEATSVENGSFGRSLRAFSPIFSEDGRQVGVVLTGITLDSIEQAVGESRLNIYFGSLAGLLVGIIGSMILAGYIKKIMFGMEPFTIAKLFEERNAMLSSVREGIVAVDQDSRITIVNEEAVKVLNRAGIFGDPIGRKVDEYVPNTRLRSVLKLGQAELDQEQELNGVTIWTNRIPVTVEGEIVGAIATFRDKTEIRQMAEKLTGVRIYADALRAQTHEFMNKLHVIIGMVRMGYHDRLTNYVNEIAHHYQEEVGFVVRKIKDPVMAGFLLGKLSKARESGVELKLADGCHLPEAGNSQVVHELITVVGNLIDNSLEAVEGSIKKYIYINFVYDEGILNIRISDSGPGMDDKLKFRIFEKGYSTKGTNRGLGLYLVKHSLDRLDGECEIISEPGKGTEFCVVIPYQKRGDNE